MTDIPMPFSAHMVRALLEGRKTMDRREEDLEPLVIYAPTAMEFLGLSISFSRPAAEFFKRFDLS